MIKREKNVYFYKLNLTNGKYYCQIWKRDKNGRGVYVASLGTADNAYKILVENGLELDQTKETAKSATKFQEELKQLSDQKPRDGIQ